MEEDGFAAALFHFGRCGRPATSRSGRKMETLSEAYALAKNNNGAPGIDGVTFAAIEAARRSGFPRADSGRTRTR